MFRTDKRRISDEKYRKEQMYYNAMAKLCEAMPIEAEQRQGMELCGVAREKMQSRGSAKSRNEKHRKVLKEV